MPVDTKEPTIVEELRNCICETCGGQGWVIVEYTESDRCSSCEGNGCGSCYDGAIPVQAQGQDGCGDCGGGGIVGVRADIIGRAADELDRLYHDHTPLTREQLEEVLKEAGWLHNWPEQPERFDYYKMNAYSCGNSQSIYTCDSGKKLQIELHTNTYSFPLSAVTRATLKACGVING